MRLIDFDKIPFLAIPIAPVVKGESVHYEQGALKEWFDGTQDVEAVPLDRIKRAREEVANYSDFHREHLYKTNPNYDVEQGQYLAYEKCLQILDDMIAEVEG
jgi:hypothetical protein